MAQLTAKNLYRGQPGTSIATLYTVTNTTDYHTIVKNIIICNTTDTAATLDMYTVASAGTAAAANQIFSDFTVEGDETVSIDLSLVLAQNETLQALQGTSAALTLTISGVEHTT
jgi:hypothetical protein|tara:strand:+ start:194 stop:535 length:342 start_codon:yes stop_codon:yes gene_type:complete